jgi:MFS family permease
LQTRTAANAPLPTAEFLLCAAANFLQGVSVNLHLHLPGFLKSLGANEMEIGTIFSLMAVAAIVVRPLVGRWMDTWGRRVMILGGGIANVVVLTLYLTIDHIGPWVYLVRISHGLTEATLFTAFFTHAADLIPAERRTEGIALFGVSGLISISTGALLGDLILSHGSYSALFVTSAALAAVSLLLSLPLHDRRPAGRGEPSRGFFAALVQKDLLPVWFVGSVFATASTPYFTFLKTLVMKIQTGSVGGFFTAFTLAAVVLRLFFGWVPDRVGKRRVLLPGLALVVIGLVVLAFSSRGIEILAAGCLCGLGHGFSFPILISLMVDRARPAERGAAMSIFTALFDAGLLLGGPTFGALILYAGYGVMFTSAAAMLVCGTVVFFLWDRPRHDA